MVFLKAFINKTRASQKTIKINGRMRWNFGYQYYGYRENFYPAQNFRADTGYTSVSWAL